MGKGKHTKARYRYKGETHDTEELCKIGTESETKVTLLTENWANDFYVLKFDEIVALKPSGSPKWIS